MTEQRDELFVSEFLQLKGYNVETNIALKSTNVGGRDEADVVGHKIHGTQVEVIHAEVGNLSGNYEKSLQDILKKFDEHHRRSVIEHIKEEIDPSGFTWNYESIYVFTYCSDKSRLKLEPALRERHIRLVSLLSLYDELPEVVNQWKQSRVKRGFSKNEILSLPQNFVVSYHLIKLRELLESRRTRTSDT